MRVHHNTVKKATAHGLVFAIDNDEAFVFRAADDGKPGATALAAAKDPKEALELALAKLNGGSKSKRKRTAKKRRQVEDEGDDEGEGDEGKTIVKRKYRSQYRPFKMTCGDSIADRVREEFMTKQDPDTKKPKLDWPKFKAFAKANGCWIPDYDKVNHGIARMSVVNRLRKKIKAKVTIIWNV